MLQVLFAHAQQTINRELQAGRPSIGSLLFVPLAVTAVISLLLRQCAMMIAVDSACFFQWAAKIAVVSDCCFRWTPAAHCRQQLGDCQSVASWELGMSKYIYLSRHALCDN